MPDRPVHQLVALQNIGDERGWLTVAEQETQVPFDFQRLFVLHSIADGATRGFHAHREQHQFLMMLAGRCRVTVDNGRTRVDVNLDSPAMGLHAPPLLWLELYDFSPGSVCAVLTSGRYDAADYIRDRCEFESMTS